MVGMIEAAFILARIAVAPSSMNSLVLVMPPFALQRPKATEPEVAGAAPAAKSYTPLTRFTSWNRLRLDVGRSTIFLLSSNCATDEAVVCNSGVSPFTSTTSVNSPGVSVTPISMRCPMSSFRSARENFLKPVCSDSMV